MICKKDIFEILCCRLFEAIFRHREFPLKTVCLLLSLFEERKKGNKGCQKVHPSHGNSITLTARLASIFRQYLPELYLRKMAMINGDTFDS